MMKDVDKTSTIHLSKGQHTTLIASFVDNEYKWNKSKEKARSIEIKPQKGETTYTVKDQFDCLKDIFKVVVSK